MFQQKVTVEKALKQELANDYPESFFRSDGTFIKKDKSTLLKALEVDITDTQRTFPTVNSCDFVIYDGMALIHSMARSIKNVKTFGDVANLVLAALLRLPQKVHDASVIAEKQHLRIDIVMDRYDEYEEYSSYKYHINDYII